VHYFNVFNQLKLTSLFEKYGVAFSLQKSFTPLAREPGPAENGISILVVVVVVLVSTKRQLHNLDPILVLAKLRASSSGTLESDLEPTRETVLYQRTSQQ
jgi:hypothetical protein